MTLSTDFALGVAAAYGSACLWAWVISPLASSLFAHRPRKRNR